MTGQVTELNIAATSDQWRNQAANMF